MALNNIESINGYLESTATDGSAISNPITKEVGSDDFEQITNIKVEYEFKNISTATVANILSTLEPILDGHLLVIVKGDGSYNFVTASGVTESLGVYSMSTTAVTAGEIPTKVYRIDEDIKFNTVSPLFMSDNFSGADPLLSTRTFSNTSTLPSPTIETTVELSATGNKMIRLEMDITR